MSLYTTNNTEKNIAIEISEISQSFALGNKSNNVLKKISLDIYDNDFLVLFGPSGCGKSTLLNIISGIQTPTSGSVVVNKKKIFELDEESRGVYRAKKFGIVHQMSYWMKSLNVLENVAMPLIISGVGAKKAMIKAKKTLKELHISDLASQIPTRLSGGEQQKVGIARALVSNPSIIIADEPTGNLDSTASDEIMSLFVMLNKELERTLIIVTHNMAYWDLGTRRIEMKDGTIIKDTNNG